ncbi:hypothetical protein CYLTODRAFT_424038 [Cylindrobasidium torrendii FP15055 ss-10]|uniref:F-box domain-containing protein n=1 Tax=Cylindrobasidium torrendii FP15055 ss-10 TaxID=1314674 RepID=A0A0D7B6J6_9AGAR|nr:hypothetical protein CYLTODRAFT_424038 [Cylindrobasidium torrendii FP15055 ss-10]
MASVKPFPPLEEDIVRNILKHLSQCDLYEVAQTSRRLHAIALPILYRNVSYGSHILAQQNEWLWRPNHELPTLRRCVLSVRFSHETPQIELPAQMTRSVTDEPLGWRTTASTASHRSSRFGSGNAMYPMLDLYAAPHFKRLETLQLECLGFGSVSKLLSKIIAIPTLRSLSIRSCTFDDHSERITDELAADFKRLCLTHLEMKEITGPRPHVYLLSPPTLRSVSCSITHLLQYRRSLPESFSMALEHLNVSGCESDLLTDYAQGFANFLRQLPQLTSLVMNVPTRRRTTLDPLNLTPGGGWGGGAAFGGANGSFDQSNYEFPRIPNLTSFAGNAALIQAMAKTGCPLQVVTMLEVEPVHHAIPALEALAHGGPSRDMRELSVDVTVWDKEFLLAAMYLFPELTKLVIRHHGHRHGGDVPPTEDFLVGMSAEYLSRFERLKCIEIYNPYDSTMSHYANDKISVPVPSWRATDIFVDDRKMDRPTVVDENPGAAASEDIVSVVAGWSRYSKTIEEVRLERGKVILRSGTVWDRYAL